MRFTIVEMKGTGQGMDLFRPDLPADTSFSLCAQLGTLCLVKIYPPSDLPITDSPGAVVADHDGQGQVTPTLLSDEEKAAIAGWMTNNGFAELVDSFNATITNRKQLLEMVVAVLGLNETTLIDGYEIP